jgi:hypothetical protein
MNAVQAPSRVKAIRASKPASLARAGSRAVIISPGKVGRVRRNAEWQIVRNPAVGGVSPVQETMESAV